MVRACDHKVADIGFKLQPIAAPVEIDCDKWRVIDRDPDPLDRRDQHVLIPVAPQNR